MKRYLQKVDSDYNAFLAKMNASGSHPLTLAMGGGSDIFYGNGSGLRKAKFRSTADNSLGVSLLAPFSVFKVDGGENLAFETETTEMTIRMGADTVQDIDGMLTTTASVPYAMNIFQLVAKSDVEILPTDMILGLGYAGHAAVALSPMMTVEQYIDTLSNDVMYTEDDAFILDLTGLYADCVNMMGNLTFIAYLARGNEDGSMQIIDIDLTYKCQLGDHREINVGPNDISLNDDWREATFNMDIFSLPIGDYVIECDNEIPDDYYLMIVGYNTGYMDSPKIIDSIVIQDFIDFGLLIRDNLNKIHLNAASIEMMMANYGIDKVAFFIPNEDGSIILSTRCSFDSINQEVLAPYYFETEGEHEVEFEYVYKFAPQLSFPREDSYFDNSCIIELNDKFWDYYDPENWEMFYGIEKINLSNNVSEDIVEDHISYLNSYQNLKEININTDKYITINNCVIDKTNWSLVDYCGTDVVVPGLVKSIGTIFSNNSKLKTVVLPNSMTSIGADAFENCGKLTSIIIPNSVTSIGSYAFENCSSLTSINIPNSVTFIGPGAFYECSNLTSVTIGNSVTSISLNAFRYCSSLISINIPDSVTSIGEYAFGSCSNLTSVTIGNGVTSIGDSAFNDCSKLISINIPTSVISIGDSAFRRCSNLTSINIPDSVTSIGDSAFSYCSNLTSINIPDSVTSIGDSAFSYCSNLTSINIPDSVTSIKNNPFIGCSNLKEFKGKLASTDSRCLIVNDALKAFAPAGLTEYTIPDSVTSIGDSAFRRCSNLTSINIPDSVTSIGDSAFSYCSNLTSINIPDSVTSIGDSAFSYCSNLTSINIPDSVTSIGDSAFSYCSNLTSINIPDSVTSIGRDAFQSCSNLTSVNISSLESWLNIKFMSGYYNYYDPNSSNPLNCGANLYLNNQLVTDLIVPDSINIIKYNAFNGCTSLKSITLPASVTAIGGSAFNNCSNLTSINILGSVITLIEHCAFRYCSNLSEITCNDITAPTIQNKAFQNVKTGGVLKVPTGATGYDTQWMKTSSYYLGYYNWTIEYI